MTKKEKQKEEQEMNEWMDKYVYPQFTPHPSIELKERIEDMRSEVLEYQNNPTDFTIMGDAFLAFFDVEGMDYGDWIGAKPSKKIEFITNIHKLADSNEIIKRVFSFSDILIYSGMSMGNPIYKIASLSMLYCISGDDGFLSEKGFAYYNIPKIRTPLPHKPDTASSPEGMFG